MDLKDIEITESVEFERFVKTGVAKKGSIEIVIAEKLFEIINDLGLDLSQETDKYSTTVFFFNSEIWIPLHIEDFYPLFEKIGDNSGLSRSEIGTTDMLSKIGAKFLEKARARYRKIKENLKTVDNPVIFNLKNCSIRFIKNEIVSNDFDKKDYQKQKFEFELNESAKYPKFRKYLNLSLPNVSDQKTIQQFLGHGLLRKTIKEEKFLFILGSGQNGKSTLYEILKLIFSKNFISAIPFHDIVSDDKNAIADLEGKTFNFSPDTKRIKNFDLGRLKKIVSKEDVQIKRMRQDIRTIDDLPVLIFAANNLPISKDADEGYWRRVTVVRFTEKISEKDKIKDLHYQIAKEESEGVFNWILQGCKDFIKNGQDIDMSENSLKEIEIYKNESDDITIFLGEYWENNTSASCKELFDLFNIYLLKLGKKSITINTFKKRMNTTTSVLKKIGINISRYHEY